MPGRLRGKCRAIAVSGGSLSERRSGKRSGEVGGGGRSCGLLPVEGLVGYRRLEPA